MADPLDPESKRGVSHESTLVNYVNLNFDFFSSDESPPVMKFVVCRLPNLDVKFDIFNQSMQSIIVYVAALEKRLVSIRTTLLECKSSWSKVNIGPVTCHSNSDNSDK